MGISSLIKPLFSPSKLIWIRSVSPIRGLTNHLIVPNDHWQPLDLRDSNLNRKATNHARIYRISGSMDPFINFGTQIARYDFSFWVSAGDIERERGMNQLKTFGISLFYFPFSGLFASLQLQFYFREFSKIFWAVRLSRAKIKCKSDFLMRAREKKKRKAERKLKSRFFDLSTLSLNCA